ncbi:MAG: hypothetical protein VBE63_16600 [Lamprobacter sp.]|uniref:hypothetical protein n=1 Tax=Lamprobacter sp. TaxID=3100796 RepID=UPI002B25AC98|nr:hypothetical protein [Lamprobacter sp.]MEA3641543.1 hypothetical protein [Lamprobacter sp.]
MPRPKPHDLSSRELLARIGLNDDAPTDLIQDQPLDDLLGELEGDLSTVLRERYALINQAHAFKPGDLVGWKPGLRNRRLPSYATPAVVLEVLSEPVRDSDPESGSTYFRERLDLVIGLIWDRDPGRGEFLSFHVDSARFQPWTEDA